MKVELKEGGSALLIVIFVIALLAAVAMGMLQLNTEDIQLVQNQINAAQAIATAEAGLNDAFARIRQGSDPNISSTINIERKSRSLVLAQAKLDYIKAHSIYHYSNSYATTNPLPLGDSYLCSVSDSGSGDNLRTITVSVGFDANGDNVLGSDEIMVTLSTKLAKRWNSG